MRVPLEKSTRDAIKAYLVKMGCRVITMTPGTGIPAGTPDLLVWLPFANGAVITMYLEVKRPRSYPTPVQRFVMDEWRAFGVPCHVVHNVDEVKAILRNIAGLRTPVA